MASELGIPLILQIGKLSQVLSSVDNQKNTLFKGQTLDQRLPISIYQVWKPLSFRYAANPSDPTVRQVAEWLLQLCGPYALQAQNIINNQAIAGPVITGPGNQSVNVNANATFSVSVTGSAPFSYQWFDFSGNPIVGATASSYIFLNSQLTDSGKTFFVKVTDVNGKTTTSNTATLTVTASIIGLLYYTSVNPGPTLQSNSDPFSYQSSFSITHNAPLSTPISSAAANNQYLVIKVPSTESAKTTWFNTNLNSGVIPDAIFENTITFGGFTYYYTRVATSLDPTAPLVLT